MRIHPRILAILLLGAHAAAQASAATTSSSSKPVKPTLPIKPLALTPKQSSASTASASTSSKASSQSSSTTTAEPLQRVALPPLLSPGRANATSNQNKNNTYLLNTWSGRIQLHLGSLFENLVQASVPNRTVSTAGACIRLDGKSCASSSFSSSSSSAAASSPSSSAGGKGTTPSAPVIKEAAANGNGTNNACDCGCGGDGSHDDDSGIGTPPAPSSSSTSAQTYIPTSTSASASASLASSRPKPTPTKTPTPTPQPKSCFPALDFKMPDEVPDADAPDGWWCDMQDEYAFLGFSYDLSSCPSLKTLRADFKRMRTEFNSRYVRLYSACDDTSRDLNADLITAAWENGLGLHMLIWFGFDGGDQWRTRKRDLVRTIKADRRAPFVVRSVVVGSEPLFDSVLEPEELAAQIMDVKDKLSNYTGKGLDGMQVTLSEMPYGFMSKGNAPSVFKAMDVVQGNVLPFFDQRATTGGQAWSLVTSAYTYFQQQAKGKKVLYTQIGWPSNDS
ncbi:hypothetical protein OC834_003716, partial [Tilletia horrida]